jgi:hypothetical protein
MGLVAGKQRLNLGFATCEVREVARVQKRKLKRFKRVVEAEQFDGTRHFPQRPQDGESVGGCSETDIPDNEHSVVVAQALLEIQLAYVQCLRLSHGPDDRVEGFGMGQRMDAIGTGSEPNDSVSRSALA